MARDQLDFPAHRLQCGYEIPNRDYRDRLWSLSVVFHVPSSAWSGMGDYRNRGGRSYIGRCPIFRRAYWTSPRGLIPRLFWQPLSGYNAGV
jgi:hypothetical protein